MSDSHRFEAFVAFAGGGAKGIVHVGALSALEEQKVKLLGVAGTSAGAIVATLAASGYKSHQILDPTNGASILAEFTKADPKVRRPTDFFGGGWWRVWLFRTFQPAIPWTFITVAIAGAVLPSALLLLLVFFALDRETGFIVAGSWFALVAVLFVLGIGMVVGLTRLQRLNDALNLVLQEKLFPGQSGRVVRMGDFGRDSRPGLKIVAANLSRRELHLFSEHATPLVPVAEAVCASIALPVIFHAWKRGRTRYMDGGIVSNLPAWPFDEDRELFPHAHTIAFDIRDDSKRGKVSALNWAPAMVQAGFFGRGQLNLRAMRNAELFVLETKLRLLDFDLSREEVCAALREAQTAAKERLGTRLTREPRILQDACDGIHRLVRTNLQALNLDSLDSRHRIRVALALQDPTYRRSVRRRYHSNYRKTDPDRAGLVDVSTGPLAEAWRSYELELELASRGELLAERNGLTRCPSWRQVGWRLSIPIWDMGSLREPREFMILIDGTAELPEGDETENAMISVAAEIATFFRDVLYRLDTKEEV